MAGAIGCLAATSVALAVHWWLATRPIQPLLAVAVFASMVAVALGTMRDHHPFPHLGAANYVTLTRAVLVALVASLAAERATAILAWVVVVVTAAVAVLDGIDGWLARRAGMSSTFGARFDMETDAFFMLVLSVLVWRHDKAGIWVITIGLMRYAFVAGGWLYPWLAQPLRSTRRGKVVAIAQLVVLGLALLPVVPVPASAVVCGAALAALAWSFAVDVRFLYRKRARPDGRAL
jgi:phosphatidylglycerophosphate synthase